MVDIMDDWFGQNPDSNPYAGGYTPEQIAAQQARYAASLKESEENARLRALRGEAEGLARTSARDYFSQRGLDPETYGGSIDQRLKELLSTVNETDPNPYTYLKDLGKDVYGTQTDISREMASRRIREMFQPEFERGRIGSATDDPFLAEINTKERSRAEDFLNNLFKRGVINEQGLRGGQVNLDEQGARVRTLLDSLGGDILEGGRENLRSIADRARARASTVNLGENFDPGNYGTEIDTAYQEFLQKLPDTLRASAGTNLYDTSGLSAIAGAAQGGQNFKFDPAALAGIIGDDEDEQRRREDDTSAGGQGPRSMF